MTATTKESIKPGQNVELIELLSSDDEDEPDNNKHTSQSQNVINDKVLETPTTGPSVGHNSKPTEPIRTPAKLPTDDPLEDTPCSSKTSEEDAKSQRADEQQLNDTNNSQSEHHESSDATSSSSVGVELGKGDDESFYSAQEDDTTQSGSQSETDDEEDEPNTPPKQIIAEDEAEMDCDESVHSEKEDDVEQRNSQTENKGRDQSAPDQVDTSNSWTEGFFEACKKDSVKLAQYLVDQSKDDAVQMAWLESMAHRILQELLLVERGTFSNGAKESNSAEMKFSSPYIYKSNFHAEIGESAFEIFDSLIDPQASQATKEKRTTLFGRELGERMVEACAPILKCGQLFIPQWRVTYEIPDDLLLLCLAKGKLFRADVAALRNVAEEFDLWNLMPELLDDLGLATAKYFGELYFRIKEDGWRPTGKIDLQCWLFVCRAYRCIKALQWTNIRGTLASKLFRCLKILQEHSRKVKEGSALLPPPASRVGNGVSSSSQQQARKPKKASRPPLGKSSHSVNGGSNSSPQKKGLPRIKIRLSNSSAMSNSTSNATNDPFVRIKNDEVLYKKVIQRMCLLQEPEDSSPKESAEPPPRVIREGFHWKEYPCLQQVLYRNMNEYFNLSDQNSLSYKNALVKIVRDTAKAHGYEFDSHFADHKLRDRITCFFRGRTRKARQQLERIQKRSGSSKEKKKLEALIKSVESSNVELRPGAEGVEAIRKRKSAEMSNQSTTKAPTNSSSLALTNQQHARSSNNNDDNEKSDSGISAKSISMEEKSLHFSISEWLQAPVEKLCLTRGQILETFDNMEAARLSVPVSDFFTFKYMLQAQGEHGSTPHVYGGFFWRLKGSNRTPSISKDLRPPPQLKKAKLVEVHKKSTPQGLAHYPSSSGYVISPYEQKDGS